MKEEMDQFVFDKGIWTHDDFEMMGWHDATIYGFTIEKSENNWTADFLLDIDYIFKWVHPIAPAKLFTFWVAPCTLVFKECSDLHIDFQTDRGCLEPIEIANLHLKSKTKFSETYTVYEWSIELQQGAINLKSVGLEQIVRQQPMHVQGQDLPLDERGGINFGRKPC